MLRALPEALRETGARRLRRPAAADACGCSAKRPRCSRGTAASGATCSSTSTRTRTTRSTGSSACSRAEHRQRLRGRRPRPVDLRLARRGHPQHPRLRAGLPRHAASSGSSRTTARRSASSRWPPRVIAHNVAAQGQDAVDGERRGRAARVVVPRVGRARGGELRRADDPGARARQGVPSATSRCSTARTPSRACSRTRCAARGIPYVIVGGVRFYERKEIKDMLAYLRLVVEPDRRRRVPPRDRRAGARHRRHVARAPRRGAPRARVGRCSTRAPPRRRPTSAASRGAALEEFARLIARLPRERADAAAAGAASTRARRHRLPRGAEAGALARGAGRLENLEELVAAAEDYERTPRRAVARGLPRQRRAASATSTSSKDGDARDADDAALRQGPRVPRGVPHGPRGGRVPARALDRTTRGDRGGAPALLRRHHARARSALPPWPLHRRAARLRAGEPSRFLREMPEEHARCS